MIKDVAFGQYYPASSGVHHLDARFKVLLMLFYVILIFFVDSFVGYAMYALFVVVATLLAKVPFRTLLRSLKGIAVLVIFTRARTSIGIGGCCPCPNKACCTPPRWRCASCCWWWVPRCSPSPPRPWS